MERILNLIFTAENIRMLVLLAFGFSGYALINGKMERMEYSMNKRIDSVEASIKEQNTHLNNSIEALTYALEKNGSLEKSDKEYVDSRLGH